MTRQRENRRAKSRPTAGAWPSAPTGSCWQRWVRRTPWNCIRLPATTSPRCWAATRQEISVLRFSPDGSLLASGSSDHSAIVFDVTAKKEVARLLGHTSRIHDIAFHPYADLVATVGDRTVRLWNPHSGQADHGTAPGDRADSFRGLHSRRWPLGGGVLPHRDVPARKPRKLSDHWSDTATRSTP